MLDLMRRHASSWLIKVLLGAIIVTFILFFGYSSFRKGMRGGRVGAGGAIAAEVNGTPISASEYEFFFTGELERLRATLSASGEEQSQLVRNIAKSSVLRQLVSRELALQQADALGLAVSDREVADAIRKVQTAQQGGEFDPVAYRHQFLPLFRNRYGMDYELLMQQDIRLEALQNLLGRIDRDPPVADEERSARWTFSVVELDPKELVAAKVVKKEEDAKAMADKLISSKLKRWAKILRPLKIKPKAIGPIRLEERLQLFGPAGKAEEYEAVFALSKEHPVVSAPFEREGKLVVVGLAEYQPKGKEPEPEIPLPGIYQEWMSKLQADAKIKSFLDQKTE